MNSWKKGRTEYLKVRERAFKSWSSLTKCRSCFLPDSPQIWTAGQRMEQTLGLSGWFSSLRLGGTGPRGGGGEGGAELQPLWPQSLSPNPNKPGWKWFSRNDPYRNGFVFLNLLCNPWWFYYGPKASRGLKWMRRNSKKAKRHADGMVMAGACRQR